MTSEKLAEFRAKGMLLDPKFDRLAKIGDKRKEKEEEIKKKEEIKRLELEKQDQEKQIKDKTGINLLITLERNGKEQFDDTVHKAWDVYHISTLADIEQIKNLNNLHYYKNIALIHHGNKFSQNNFNNDNKVILNSAIIKEIKKAIIKSGEIPDDLDDSYFAKIVDECKFITLKNSLTGEIIKGISEKQIKSFFSLKLLISQISDGGCFFSVACDEADDIKFFPEFADFTNKEIKIYGNRNYSIIQSGSVYPATGKPLIIGFGSILNSFLTSSDDWKDSSGWVYYDTKTKDQIITKKDLWINSNNKKKPFELIYRKKQLSKEQKDKENFAQMYFSKKFKKEYIERWKIAEYEKWKKAVETKYPEFK